MLRQSPANELPFSFQYASETVYRGCVTCELRIVLSGAHTFGKIRGRKSFNSRTAVSHASFLAFSGLLELMAYARHPVLFNAVHRLPSKQATMQLPLWRRPLA
jgi:hypothetical protein